jgi:hypothetical protein
MDGSEKGDVVKATKIRRLDELDGDDLIGASTARVIQAAVG